VQYQISLLLPELLIFCHSLHYIATLMFIVCLLVYMLTKLLFVQFEVELRMIWANLAMASFL